MKIEDGLYVLEIISNAMGKPEMIYPTLISDNDSLILIDTGIPGLGNQICEAIKNESLDPSKLNKIIFTHQDIDHIGSANEIVKKIPNNINTYCYVEEKPYIDGEKTPIKISNIENNLANLPDNMKTVCTMLKRGFDKCKIQIDETLVDGQELPYLGGITVIHTPGHTPGHISLYVKKYKTLIAGDTLCIYEGKLISQNEKFNSDNAQNIKSAEKLMKYNAKNIICYHGGIYTND